MCQEIKWQSNNDDDDDDDSSSVRDAVEETAEKHSFRRVFVGPMLLLVLQGTVQVFYKSSQGQWSSSDWTCSVNSVQRR